MKTLLKMSLSAAMFAIAAPFAFSQSDVLTLVNDSHELSSKALKDYTLSMEKLHDAESVVTANMERFSELNAALYSIEFSLQKNQNEIKDLSEILKKQNANFTDACTFLDSSGQNLKAASNVLPLGELRLKLGEKLCDELSALVLKNPDKDYRDKNYADAIISKFVWAKKDFLQTRTTIAQELVNTSISTPRIDGIKNFMKLAQEYLEKASSIKNENSANIAPLKDECTNLSKSATLATMILNEQYEEFKTLKIDFIKSRISLDSFVMNKLPQIEGGKYFNITFKPDLEIRNLVFLAPKAKYEIEWGNPKVFAASAPRAKADAATQGSLMKNINVKDAPMYQIRKNSNDDTKSIRSEILEKCNELTNLTCEIVSATNVLTDIIKDTQSALKNVENIEYLSQHSLRTAIDITAQSQSLASEIQIFKGKLQVAKVQAQISQNEFDTLCGASKTARTNSAKDIAKLNEILAKLNSLK